MAGAFAWIRRSLMVVAGALLGACATSPAPLPVPAPEGVDAAAVVVAGCAIDRIHPTGKRHQSYVFECRVMRVSRGVSESERATFELYDDFGGAKLLDDLKVDRRAGPWELVDGAASHIQLEYEALAPERWRQAFFIGQDAKYGRDPVMVNCRVIGWSVDGGVTWRTPLTEER